MVGRQISTSIARESRGVLVVAALPLNFGSFNETQFRRKRVLRNPERQYPLARLPMIHISLTAESMLAVDTFPVVVLVLALEFFFVTILFLA